MNDGKRIGTVAGLWRYPVKSMLGERCPEVELDARGVRGDRLFAIRDGEGRLGSGKNSRRHRDIAGLFSLQASSAQDGPEITFPDGRRLRVDDPLLNDALSKLLGVPVTLVREERFPHFDDSALHLVCTSVLDWLASQMPASQIDERRFRPNITLATPAAEMGERAWVGKTLHIGEEVRLKVTAPTERCRMTTLAQADLPADAAILRGLAQYADLQFGVYAEVLRPGRIACGDPVSLHEG